MKAIKLLVLGVFIAIAASAWRMAPLLNLDYAVSTNFSGQCAVVEGVTGAEDITIDKESGIAYIGADDRRSYLTKGENEPENGGLWMVNLEAEDTSPIPVSANYPDAFHPHGISLLKEGDTTFIFVINHVSTTEHQIDVFEILEGSTATLIDSISFPELISPNDLHAISRTQFFITNDHLSPRQTAGEKLEDAFRLANTNVLFYDDGKVTEVANGLSMANGVIANSDLSKLYVAESTGERISVFENQGSNVAWQRVDAFELDVMVDNLEWDEQGNLLVGSHPKALDFLMHTFDASKIAPSIAHRIDVNTGQAEIIYEDDGQQLSGSSVAASYKNNLLVGTVFEPHYVHCKANSIASR